MHMRVDAAWEREAILGVKDLAGEIGLNLRREPGHLSVLDRDIKTIDRGLVRPNHSGILDDRIEKLVHARHSLAYWRFLLSGADVTSYRLPRSSISGVPINRLSASKSTMRSRNGCVLPCAASEA